MIDFRYHLVSLVAVLLALGVGIIMGSGLLGGPILDYLERSVTRLEARVDRYQTDISDQRDLIEQHESFQRAVEPWLVGGELRGAQIVLFQFDGTDADLTDGVRESIVDSAGGAIAATITVTDKFGLANEVEFDQLALAAGSSASDSGALLRSAATALGSRAGDAANLPLPNARPQASAPKLVALLDSLQEAGFISVDTPVDEAVPPRARFVVAGGSEDAAPFDVAAFTAALGQALAQERADVVVVEDSTSTWDLTASLRDDASTRDQVATIDHGDSLQGRMALVLVLATRRAGPAPHYGRGEGAEVFPEPAPPA